MARRRGTIQLSVPWLGGRPDYEGAGKLRNEDSTNDWEGTGAPRRRPFHHQVIRSPIAWGLWLTLLGLAAGGWVYQHRAHKVHEAVINQGLTVKTQLELAVVASLVRDHRIAEGHYPEDFSEFLRKSLRNNKQYTPGNDFWGRPYVLETYEGGFLVRSAGPDGRYGTEDDVTCKASLKE